MVDDLRGMVYYYTEITFAQRLRREISYEIYGVTSWASTHGVPTEQREYLY